MKYRAECMLPAGGRLTLRSLCPDDARQAISVCRQAAGESRNMMRREQEWSISEAQEAALLQKMENDPQAMMLGAFIGGELVGCAALQRVHPGERARHRACVGISILRAYCGRGIGTAMLRVLIGQARHTLIEQIELDVVSDNEAAIRLYRKCGFVEYGRHPRAMKYRDGTYADTLLMMLKTGEET